MKIIMCVDLRVKAQDPDYLGQQLSPNSKKNPIPIFPILENLRNDESEYVRRSVANNLNDITKDHPKIVIEIAKKWKGQTKETDAIIKHACRTLLKDGNQEILKFYKLIDNPKLEIAKFKLSQTKILIGESLGFSFIIQNLSSRTENIRLEYAIHYLRQNGSHSKKVFKITEKEILPFEKLKIIRKQSFKIITTRKFYLGIQKLSLILNGKEKKIIKFELMQ